MDSTGAPDRHGWATAEDLTHRPPGVLYSPVLRRKPRDESHSRHSRNRAHARAIRHHRAAHRPPRQASHALQGVDSQPAARRRDGGHRHVSQQAVLAVAARSRDRHSGDRLPLGRRLRAPGPHPRRPRRRPARTGDPGHRRRDAIRNSPIRTSRRSTRSPRRWPRARSCRTRISRLSRKYSGATASPRCWCCSAITPPSRLR